MNIYYDRSFEDGLLFSGTESYYVWIEDNKLKQYIVSYKAIPITIYHLLRYPRLLDNDYKNNNRTLIKQFLEAGP